MENTGIESIDGILNTLNIADNIKSSKEKEIILNKCLFEKKAYFFKTEYFILEENYNELDIHEKIFKFAYEGIQKEFENYIKSMKELFEFCRKLDKNNESKYFSEFLNTYYINALFFFYNNDKKMYDITVKLLKECDINISLRIGV